MRVIVRAWADNEYHKDIVIMDENQVHMHYKDTEPKGRHILVSPIDAVRVVIDPKLFPEMVEFEIIVQKGR